MYKAVIFDLDGTLVQTEKLKALSYARAAVKLKPKGPSEQHVIEEFKQVVGRSRQEVSAHLLAKFGLEEAARSRMAEFKVNRPWQAFAQVRLRIYEEMLADPVVLRSHQWPHNVELLERVHKNGCVLGLATMSHCEQARRVLDVLGLSEHFDFVATRNDVDHPKPHPEIYLLVASELDVSPAECLVIEDSPSGVQAARAAGMGVIAVTTPMTRQAFREKDILDRRWVVDDTAELPAVVLECIVAHQDKHVGGSCP